MGVWDKNVPMRAHFCIIAVIWLWWEKVILFSPLPPPRTSTMPRCQVSEIQDSQNYCPRKYVPLSQTLRWGGSWWLYNLFYMSEVSEGFNFQGTYVLIFPPLIPLLYPSALQSDNFYLLEISNITTCDTMAWTLWLWQLSSHSLQNGRISFLEVFSST